MRTDDQERRLTGRGRRPEPRITNPETHPKRYVNLSVAAEYLSVSRRTLLRLIDEGKVPVSDIHGYPKILLTDLIAFERAAKRAS